MIDGRRIAPAVVGSASDRDPGQQETSAAKSNMRDLLQILIRRKTVIAGCTGLLTVAAGCIVFVSPTSYTAEAILMLDSQKARVMDVPAVMPELPSDQAIVRSEIEVLKSPALAEQVAAKLGLAEKEEFNPASKSSFWRNLAIGDSPIAQLFRWLRLAKTEELTDGAVETASSEDKIRDDVALAVADRLNVANDGRSYVLKIRFTASSGALAATIANAYAELYLRNQLETKKRATERASGWLDAQLKELRDKDVASDRSVELFREQHQLTEARGATVVAQQLAELNSQLIAAVGDRTQKEAALKRVEAAVRSGNAAALTEVMNSPLIQRLQEQEAGILRQQSELSNRFLPNHPAMAQVMASRGDLRKKIEAEGKKLVQAVAEDFNAAHAREDALRQRLQELQESAAASDRSQAQLRALEREAGPVRALYENFLARAKQASFEGELQQPDARLVSRALVPKFPSSPNRRVFLAVSFVGAASIGLLLALLLERLDDGFRSSDQIESAAGVAALGLIPEIGRRNPHNLIVERPISSYAEAIRSFRTGLKFSVRREDLPRVIAITSAVTQEGKTTFTCSLAESVAKSGGRVLIIDCDLRRPSIERIFGHAQTSAPDLVSALSGRAELPDVVRHDDSSGVDYVPTIRAVSNPQDLLESDKMHRFLEAARREYDMVVLDAPPVLAASDAVLLSHLADATIFLVRWGLTPRSIALGAIRMLRNQGGNLAGVVLSRVSLRKHARYRTGDIIYYFARYGEYPLQKDARELLTSASGKETDN
jgi:succinoglycan biosynthesis transport protein ExoP